MGEKTNIEWCDSTASPWTGCTKVSPGCANCYAADLAKRYGWCEWGPGKPRHKFKGFAANCRKWNKKAGQQTSCGDCDPCVGGRPDQCAITPVRRPKIFPSLCDPWDKEVPLLWRLELLHTAWQCGNLDFLLLSKRVELWRELMNDCWKHSRDALQARFIESPAGRPILPPEDEADSFRDWLQKWIECGEPPHNVWIGASVEDQQRADERIPELLKIPAKVRFLSCEPLLGPIELPQHLGRVDAPGCISHGDLRDWIDWVIVGGESGPKARPCNLEWIRSIVTQCKQANVPCYVKQLGSRPVGHSWNPEFSIYIDHPKGGYPEEWPEDLRVREMPR